MLFPFSLPSDLAYIMSRSPGLRQQYLAIGGAGRLMYSVDVSCLLLDRLIAKLSWVVCSIATLHSSFFIRFIASSRGLAC
jgi:hypothetical protein